MTALDMNHAASAARKLPPRQRAVLACLCRGLLIKETADKLNISESTVRNTRTIVYSKIGVNKAVDAVRAGFLAGIVS